MIAKRAIDPQILHKHLRQYTDATHGADYPIENLSMRMFRPGDQETYHKILTKYGEPASMSLWARVLSTHSNTGTPIPCFTADDLRRLDLTSLPVYLRHRYTPGKKFTVHDKPSAVAELPGPHSIPIGRIVKCDNQIADGQLWTYIELDPSGLSPSELKDLRQRLADYSLGHASVCYQLVENPNNAKDLPGVLFHTSDNIYCKFFEVSLCAIPGIPGGDICIVKASGDIADMDTSSTSSAVSMDTSPPATTTSTSSPAVAPSLTQQNNTPAPASNPSSGLAPSIENSNTHVPMETSPANPQPLSVSTQPQRSVATGMTRGAQETQFAQPQQQPHQHQHPQQLQQQQLQQQQPQQQQPQQQQPQQQQQQQPQQQQETPHRFARVKDVEDLRQQLDAAHQAVESQKKAAEEYRMRLESMEKTMLVSDFAKTFGMPAEEAQQIVNKDFQGAKTSLDFYRSQLKQYFPSAPTAQPAAAASASATSQPFPLPVHPVQQPPLSAMTAPANSPSNQQQQTEQENLGYKRPASDRTPLPTTTPIHSSGAVPPAEFKHPLRPITFESDFAKLAQKLGPQFPKSMLNDPSVLAVWETALQDEMTGKLFTESNQGMYPFG